MRIGIDGSCLSRNFSSGVKNYTINLIRELAAIDKSNKYFIFSSSPTLLPKQNNISYIHIPKIPVVGRQLIMPIIVSKYKLDIFHFPEPYGSIFLSGPKIITTVHDIDLNTVYPKKNKYIFKKAYSIFLRLMTFKHSSVFIASSKSTSRDLRKQFSGKIKGKMVAIVHLAGWNEKLYFVKKRKHGYLMCLGDFSPRKNIDLLLISYKVLRKDYGYKSTLLIVVSTKQVFEIYSKRIQDLGLNKCVKLIKSPSNSELINLYSNALVFIYPSLYEGFGIPILEAMACGCPVITSNYGSMKEVAKDSALLINPRSETSLITAILTITNDKKFRKSLIKKGLVRAKVFSWRKTAQEVLKNYQRAISL